MHLDNNFQEHSLDRKKFSHTFSLINLNKIKPIKKFNQTCVNDLKNRIEKKGVWVDPIIVEKDNFFILEGHLRFQVAKELDFKYIPCLIIDYHSLDIKVYCQKTNNLLSKNNLLETDKNNKFLPYESTKHFLLNSTVNTSFSIDFLKSINTNHKVVKLPYEISYPNIYTQIDFLIPTKIFLKNEGLNVSGSIKHKPALRMIKALEEKYGSNLNLIESSSGSLGVALSLICKSRKHHFTCVVDPNIQKNKERLIKLYGSKIIKVSKKDNNGGYLGTRINTILKMLKSDSSLIWINQYENKNNSFSHYETTAQEIFNAFQDIDYLFIGAGTTGNIMGCADFFKKYSPHTKIIAVDVEGSVTFGGLPQKRLIPGLGTSRVPPLCDPLKINQVIYISEKETVKMCQDCCSRGFLYGGSTGSVLAGIVKFHKTVNSLSQSDKVIAISPDFGEHYLSTIYSKNWIDTHINSQE